MNDLFATVYEFFLPLYGDGLAGYLYGFCSNEGEGIYAKVGLSMLLITILTCLAFYFLFADSKRYKLKYWISFLAIASILSGVISFYLPYIDLNSGFVCNDYIFDIENIIFFGILNFLLSGILFFIISIGLKYIGKAQARHTPF